MVARRWPLFINATAMCIAIVVFPEPPFSFPTTMTCGVVANPASTCNMTLGSYSCVNVLTLPDSVLFNTAHGTHAFPKCCHVLVRYAQDLDKSCRWGRPVDRRPGNCRRHR